MITNANIHIYNEIACFFVDSALYSLPVVIYFDAEDIPKISKGNWQISQVNYKDITYTVVRETITRN